MNRRTFLKSVGLAVCGVGSLFFKPANLFGVKVIANCRNWLRQQHRIEPVEIDGEKYFFISVHPRQMYQLKVITAKGEYKHQRHVERYDRWAKSQGKPPHLEVEGELGTWSM